MKALILIALLFTACSPKLGKYLIITDTMQLPYEQNIVYYGYSWPGERYYLFVQDQIDTFKIGDTCKMYFYTMPDYKRLILRKVNNYELGRNN